MATVTRVTAAPAPGGRRLSLQTFSAFQSRNFTLLWANNLTFALSQSFRQFAFTWLALELFSTGQALGLIIFALGLPILIFGLPAGALADRIDRRLLLFASQVSGLVVTLLTASLIWAGAMTTPITMGLALALGATVAFGQPVRVAIVPSLVEPSKLLNAVTLMSLSQNVSMIAGPAIGGAMVAIGGLGMAFAGQAVLLGLGLLALLPLRVPAVDRSGPRRNMLGEVREGLAFVAGHPGIRTLMLVLLITALVMAGTFMTLLPKIAREDLGVGPFETAMFFTAMGVGMLMSSLLLASFSRLDRAGLWFIVTLIGGGILNSAFGLVNLVHRVAGDHVHDGLERGLLHQPEPDPDPGEHPARSNGPGDEHLHALHGGRHAPGRAAGGGDVGCLGVARVVRGLRPRAGGGGRGGTPDAAEPAPHALQRRHGGPVRDRRDPHEQLC